MFIAIVLQGSSAQLTSTSRDEPQSSSSDQSGAGINAGKTGRLNWNKQTA
jgi:hypothetical protein